MLDRMYTTKEAAKILGYANDAVIRLMIKQKRLKARKFGHIWMISAGEVEKINERKH